MAKAAIYIRWSTEDQALGTTLQVQRSSCFAYCDREGLYVPEDLVFVDEGWSGGNLARPAMDRLRAAVRAGLVDMVVVYRLDRLSRDLADATGLVGKEWKGKALVRSATEDVCPEADEGWLNYSFRATFADYERRVIKQRTYAGKVRRLQEGLKVAGGAPYGYNRTAKPGVFEVDEEQAEVVRAIFYKCARENVGLITLAKWLNEMGYKPPRAALWGAPTVRLMLLNPVYKGHIVFGRQKFLKRSSGEEGPWRKMQEPVVSVAAAPGTLPALVSEELWEQAQGAIARRRSWMEQTSGRSLGSDRLLTGLIYCRCGARLCIKQRQERRKDVFRCLANDTMGVCTHKPAYIPVPLLDEIVVQQLLGRLKSEAFQERLGQAVDVKVRNEMAALAQRRDGLDSEVEGLSGELRFLDAEYRKQRITIEEARRLRGQVEEERAGLLRQLAEVETMLMDQQKALREQQAAVGQVELARQWDTLTNQQRRQVLRNFIQRIEAYRSRETGEVSLQIQWAFETDTQDQEIRVEAPKGRPFKKMAGGE